MKFAGAFLLITCLSAAHGYRSLLQQAGSNTAVNYNPVAITVNSAPFDILATPITPVLPYSQAAYQCNVTGDSRYPPYATGTFPLTVSVPVGQRVRVIFANGNLNGATVTQQGQPGVIVQQGGAVIVQQLGGASPIVQNVGSPVVQTSATPAQQVNQGSPTVVQQPPSNPPYAPAPTVKPNPPSPNPVTPTPATPTPVTPTPATPTPVTPTPGKPPSPPPPPQTTTPAASPPPPPQTTTPAASPPPPPQTTTPSPQTTTPSPQTTTPSPQTTTPSPQTTTPSPQTTTPSPQTTTPSPQTTTPSPETTKPTDKPETTTPAPKQCLSDEQPSIQSGITICIKADGSIDSGRRKLSEIAGAGRNLLQNTVPGGPNNGLVEYVALVSSNTVPGFVVPNTQFGVPYVEFTASSASAGQTAVFQGTLAVANVVGGVPQYPFTPNNALSPFCQVNVNFKNA